ncbi:MAG: glycosyltransferase [Bacteriovorax sp.]|nr:glycosyltransferase [Bacteriovorax sp.]
MISIISITFNNFEELKNTINSISNIPNVESIVINGGSCELTKEFLKTYSGISISEKDEGISDAFNKGLKLVTGEAIMFLNSGDLLIDPTYLKEVDDLLKLNSEISYVHSDILYDDVMLGPIHIESTSKPRSLAKGMPYPHQSLIIRKEVFNTIGNFDKAFKLAMDYDLVLRMFKIRCKGFHVPRMTVRMDGGGVSSKFDYRILNENFKALRKNHFLTPKICLRMIMSYLLMTVKITLVKINCTLILKIIKRVGRKVKI